MKRLYIQYVFSSSSKKIYDLINSINASLYKILEVILASIFTKRGVDYYKLLKKQKRFY